MSALADHRVFLGASDGALYRFGPTGTDLGAAILARQETVRVAPAGPSGEVVLHAVFPIFASTGAVTVRVTPIVNGIPYDGVSANSAMVSVALPQSTDGQRLITRPDIGLSQPVYSDGVVIGRVGLRGTWISFRYEVMTTIGLDIFGEPGVLYYEGSEIEFEEVGSTATKVASPGP